ncbi:glycosyltransferase family 61 protein [Sediminicoccus sp. KRV36]|uniref:glycosyltransferase family 61 protein n=1 Tax=Sediminicoccus sp. KRV36 TaxID=3133721 RepID=UPI00200F904F|nr:glycosyltransferase family 61 protein [Sediminicoccus rosea]UPY37358.1 glycosyltransferase family 61 protein [Sediminicoccus rosea]
MSSTDVPAPPSDLTAAELADLERSVDVVFAAPIWLRREHEKLLRLAKHDCHASVAALLEARFVERNGLPDLGAGLFPSVANVEQIGRKTEVFAARLEQYPEAMILSAEAPAAIALVSGIRRPAPSIDAIALESGEFFHAGWQKLGITYALRDGIPHIVPELSARHHEGIYARGGRRAWTGAAFKGAALKADTLAVICDAFPDPNYCHWLLDWMPRFRVIQAIEPDVSKLSVFLSVPPRKFQIDFLNSLGISPDRILVGQKDGGFSENLVSARRIIGSSLTNRSFRHGLHGGGQWASNFLRQAFSVEARKPSLNIIIKRKKDRNLVFDAITAKILDDSGYQDVYLEDLDINKQVEIFSNSASVIAPHGAGLANIVFCQPGTKILEIFPVGHSTAAYFFAAHASNLAYFCAVGSRPGDQTKPNPYEYDIQVPSEIMENFLSHTP